MDREQPDARKDPLILFASSNTHLKGHLLGQVQVNLGTRIQEAQQLDLLQRDAAQGPRVFLHLFRQGEPSCSLTRPPVGKSLPL